MAEREAQIGALWTYEVSTEKVLKRAVKKGYIAKEEADPYFCANMEDYNPPLPERLNDLLKDLIAFSKTEGKTDTFRELRSSITTGSSVTTDNRWK